MRYHCNNSLYGFDVDESECIVPWYSQEQSVFAEIDRSVWSGLENRDGPGSVYKVKQSESAWQAVCSI